MDVRRTNPPVISLDHVVARFADYADDAFIIADAEPLDASGPRVVWCNAAFERMTGYSRDEMIGNTPRMLQGPNTDPVARANIRQALGEWRSVRQEILNYRKDGETFWVELIIHPVADETGWVHYWAAIQRNITDRKRYELALEEGARRLQAEVAERRAAEEAAQRTAAELQLINDELQQFAFVLSHDLLAPARRIAMFAELLDKSYAGEDDDVHDYARFIGESSQRLRDLVGALSRYANAGSGAALLDEADVDLNAVLQAAVQVFDEPLKDAGGAVTLDTLPRVRGDAALLGQLFQNLLSNAMKYRSAAPPQIQVQAAPAPQDGTNFWRISVLDNGQGFAPEDAERIFKAMTRLHRADHIAGSGLGLSICRRIATRHGGRIWAEPRPEGGAAFHVLLPGASPAADDGEAR